MGESSDTFKLLHYERAARVFDSVNNNDSLDVDDALKSSGGYGRYQFTLQALVAYLILSTGYHYILPYFIGDDPAWICVTRNSSSFCRVNYGVHISSESSFFNERCKLPREDWTYTTSKFYSFTTEYDLVCEDSAVSALVSSAFYIGGLFGSLISGILADTFGRKKVILYSLLVSVILSFGCVYVKSVVQLGILRCILGSTHVAFFYTGVVYLSEFVIPKWQTLSTNIYLMSLTLSFLLIDLLSYYVREWRTLQFYASCPSILALGLLTFTSESPRWLLAKGKQTQAEKVIEKISKANRKCSTFIVLKPPCDINETDLYTYVDLCRTPRVLTLTISTGMMWFTVPLIYYAIAMEASKLGGGMYGTFALLTTLDIPTYFLAAYTCNRFGRKASTLVSLLVAGLLMGAVAFVPKLLPSRYIVNLVLVIPAKFFIEMAFGGIYCWSIEIFPTVLRTQGISLCAIFERVGLLLVPFITRVLQNESYILPFLFMLVLSLFTCAVGLSLPETRNQPTRESYDDFFTSTSSGRKTTCC